MVEPQPQMPLEYQSARPPPVTSRRLSWIQRAIFGIVLPNLLLAIGFYLSLRRLDGKGDRAGAFGIMFFMVAPFLLVGSVAFSAFLVPKHPRTRLGACIIGGIIPLILILIAFLVTDMSLPPDHQLFPW